MGKNTDIEQLVDKSIIDAIATLKDSTASKALLKAADTVAQVFGAPSNLFEKETADFADKLIPSFQKNLSLLIQKTWVEQADADLKEQVLYQLNEFCKAASRNKWRIAYPSLLQIITDVVYLMFGPQTKTEDFIEYALRIDPEFGVFWLYIKNLPDQADWEEEKYRVVMLLGMYFLANY
ncbi:MAG: hypothetical protein MJ169_08565 [Treponema sp.]|nr:hypothetical protein [Treponema sp.]